MNVEETLREIREKSALLRYLTSSVATNPEVPDRDVLAGLAGLCEDIEERARGIFRTVRVDVLSAEIKAERRR